jgi:hypothetical protein
MQPRSTDGYVGRPAWQPGRFRSPAVALWHTPILGSHPTTSASRLMACKSVRNHSCPTYTSRGSSKRSPRRRLPPPAASPRARNQSGRQSAQRAARAAGLQGSKRAAATPHIGAHGWVAGREAAGGSKEGCSCLPVCRCPPLLPCSPSRKVSLGSMGVRMIPCRRSASPLQQ